MSTILKSWIVLLLFSSTLTAAGLPCPECKLEVLDDFSGGLNTTLTSHKMNPKFSNSMFNVFVHRKPGTLVTRNGLVTVGSTNTLRFGSYMFTFNKENGEKEFIVSDSSVVLITKDFQTFTLIASTLNTGVNLDCAQVRNKVWCTDGVDPVFTWDGTGKVVLDGTAGTPNVPRGKYIEFDQERVWLGNLTSDGSGTAFSEPTSTSGLIIAPDNFLAWPSGNILESGRGDGQVITGLWVYKGQLQIGKERSIYTRYGTSSSAFFARKTESQTGPSSNDSIVVLDGYTYFKGLQGIYQYDSANSERISDAIVAEVAAMDNSTTKALQNSWETQADFGRGSFYGSTATSQGVLTINSAGIDLTGGTQGAFLSTMTVSTLSDGATVYGPIRLNVSAGKVDDSYFGFISKIQPSINRQSASPGGQNPFLRMSIYNLISNQSTSAVISAGNFVGVADALIYNSQMLFAGYEINQSSLAVKFERINDGATVDNIVIGSLGGFTFTLSPATTGQFISDITTISMVTSWGNFDSARVTNGGSINYYVRTSTSVVNISTRTWGSISPGVRINAPTVENYIQWATTITAISTGNPAAIDNVTIEHVEGSGNVNRAFAIDWNNEYWLSIATETSGNFSIQYVKSWITNPTPNAWNPLYGQNIRSFTKDSTTSLYAGSASTGSFYRLDYGTNDNNLKIISYWESPELTLGDNAKDKKIFEIWIDADKATGKNFKLGVAVNDGAFADSTISLDGSGRAVSTYSNLYTGFGNTYKFRLKEDQIDQNLNFHSLGIWYQPLGARSSR